MFKPYYDICKCHNKKRLIVVKRGLCQQGNNETKKKKVKLNSCFKKNTKKATGEAGVFQTISTTRKHECFICKKPLYILTASNFMHVLPKAQNKFPEYKLYPKNIVLGCHDYESSCHDKWDKQPRSNIINDSVWQPMFELENELKEEYKLIKRT